MRRLLVVAAAALAAAIGPVPAAAQPSGPALEVPAADLDAALACPSTFTNGPHDPLLLVHGTYTTPGENWGWNYARVLPPQGWDVCTVALPDRSTGDMQVQAEYVVHAIREVARRSGRSVDVLGHSQGGLHPRWAVAWWPDVRDVVDDLVTLATPHHGTEPAKGAETLGTGCHPSCMQMRPGSDYLTALNRDDETPGAISYTSVYSLTDELVQPAVPEATAALAGASNVLIQDLCPGRPVEHAQFAADAAVHAVVLDALTHDGPFDPARFDPTSCAGVFQADGDPELILGLMQAFDPPAGFFAAGDEPPLKPYAQDSGGGGGGGSPDRQGADDSDAGATQGAESADVLGEVAGARGSDADPLPATGGLGAWPILGPVLVAAGGLGRRRFRR